MLERYKIKASFVCIPVPQRGFFNLKNIGIMEFVKRALINLEDKKKSFIGSLKDEVTVSNSDGFRKGLDWAIGSINDAIELEKANCIYKKTQNAPFPRVEYKADCGFIFVKSEGYKIGNSNERLSELDFPEGQCMKCKRHISK